MAIPTEQERALTDPWLTAAEVGQDPEVDLLPRTVKKLINEGAFGEIGNGATDTPVKKIPYTGGMGGFTYYVRTSAKEAYKIRKRIERESVTTA